MTGGAAGQGAWVRGRLAANLLLGACANPGDIGAQGPEATARTASAAPGSASAQRGELLIDVGMHTQSVTGIATDARGRWVATVSGDKTLRIWSRQSMELLKTIRTPAGAGVQGGAELARYEIAMLNSARDLVDRQSRPAGAGARALVVGAPDYWPAPGGNGSGRSRTSGVQFEELRFEPLPGVPEEAQRVADVVRRTWTPELLTGSRATESALHRTRSPALMRLATHGFFLDELRDVASDEDPLQTLSRSGLTFANANAMLAKAAVGGDDGILTALETTTLDLRGTQLVVLSACDTAVGQTVSGDGVYGLSRAFREAGARSVLATLWPVDDEGTREFMQRFCRRLVSGEPPQAALRGTQLEFIASREWNDPHYWAPFVLVGR